MSQFWAQWALLKTQSVAIEEKYGRCSLTGKETKTPQLT